MTIKELAEITRIRKSYIEKIEQGNAIGMHVSHLSRIVQALKIQLPTLFIKP